MVIGAQSNPGLAGSVAGDMQLEVFSRGPVTGCVRGTLVDALPDMFAAVYCGDGNP
jgi:hypothetical protein